MSTDECKNAGTEGKNAGNDCKNPIEVQSCIDLQPHVQYPKVELKRVIISSLESDSDSGVSFSDSGDSCSDNEYDFRTDEERKKNICDEHLNNPLSLLDLNEFLEIDRQNRILRLKK